MCIILRVHHNKPNALKGIGFKIILEKFYENAKHINLFFTNFYISHENVIEIFLKNGQITNARASFNRIK